jgi:two-component system, OmpR family, sensor histidine kinase KdpD
MRSPEVDAELKRLKIEVLSKIAHDVRAPLSVVLTGLKELRETAPAFDEYQKSVFKLVCSSAETSLQLLKDLHDLARIEEKCLPLQRGTVDVAAIVRGVVGAATAKVGEKAAPTKIEAPDHPVLLYVDEARLAQAVSALLENAIRVAQTQARLVVREQEGAVQILVEDDGVGVPPKEVESIFSPDSQKNVRPGGTGLGLAVARGLVEAHGGKVWAENVLAPDGRVQGARFVVTLPKPPT